MSERYLPSALRSALAGVIKEARIAAEHCLSSSFEQTNWPFLSEQYTLLEKLKPNPIIKLNLAIIQSKIQGIEKSLATLENLTTNDELSKYHLLPATQGIFYMKLGDYEKAIVFLEESLTLNPSARETTFIEGKIEECGKLLLKN